MNRGKGCATFDCERTTWITISIIGIAIYPDTDTPVIVGGYFCAGMQNGGASNGKASAIPVVKIPRLTVMVKRAIVGGDNFRIPIDIQVSYEDAETPTSVAGRNNRRATSHSQFAKIAAEAAFAIAFIGIVITSFYCGRTFDSNIYRVGGDAVMVTLRCRQGRVVRDNNLPRDCCVIMIYVFVRINIDAAATALSLFTRLYLEFRS